MNIPLFERGHVRAVFSLVVHCFFLVEEEEEEAIGASTAQDEAVSNCHLRCCPTFAPPKSCTLLYKSTLLLPACTEFISIRLNSNSSAWALYSSFRLGLAKRQHFPFFASSTWSEVLRTSNKLHTNPKTTSKVQRRQQLWRESRPHFQVKKLFSTI